MATIAINFDGCVVKHAFPAIGPPCGATPVLKELVKNGHKLILWTTRADSDKPTVIGGKEVLAAGNYLHEAMHWFSCRGIELYGVNYNPDQKDFVTSQKIFAHIYIENNSLGIPLIKDDTRIPYVNWLQVLLILANNGYIKITRESHLEDICNEIMLELKP